MSYNKEQRLISREINMLKIRIIYINQKIEKYQNKKKDMIAYIDRLEQKLQNLTQDRIKNLETWKKRTMRMK